MLDIKKEINMYINGYPYIYHKINNNKRDITSFLIPKLYDDFINHIKLGNKFIYNYAIRPNDIECYWCKFFGEVSYQIFENVYLNENFFELRIIGDHRLIDNSDIRDMKIKYLIDIFDN